MRTGFLVSAIVAASLALTPLASDAGEGKHGWHRGDYKHHRGNHHGHYRHVPRPQHYHKDRHWHYGRHNHGAGYHPRRYAYRAPYYGSHRHHRDSPIGIIVGGVIGGVLGSEISHGDAFTTGAGAIAGGVIGHELAR